MAGIGGPDPARLLVAVERQHIGAQRLVEEALVEAARQHLRLDLELGGVAGLAELPRDLRRRAPRAIDIGLNLDQGDRSASKRAVGVENRIVAVLPALVDQPFRGLAAVFDETVA